VANAAMLSGQTDRPAGPPVVAGGIVPFFYGTNQYVEKFDTTSQLLDANQHEIVRNVIPGGFMRGVRMQVRSTGGVLGTGAVAADGPYTLFPTVTLENMDGSPIIYPMSAWTQAYREFYGRYWNGDPTRRFDFSNTVNPSFSLWMKPEIRHTACVMANTDSRSQYKIRYIFATFTAFMGTVGTATAPTVTVTLYLETWAQPDKDDLNGHPIEELPPGLNLAVLFRHQSINLAAAGSNNTLQLNLMGNEIRLFLWVMRDSTGARADLASDPIRWRLDDKNLGVFSPDELFNRMADFYSALQTGSTRPTGLYAWPRFFNPGDMIGESWMTTNNATYCIWETATAAGGTNGTVEIVVEEVVTRGDVPLELESI
jgi:hypothetical protein